MWFYQTPMIPVYYFILNKFILISLKGLDVKIHWFNGFLSNDYVIYLTKLLNQDSELWGTVAFG